MSRYTLSDVHPEYRDICVGHDEGADALFLQCAREPDAEPDLWYVRLETMHELELVLQAHAISLPDVLRRQLESELEDVPPDVRLGDHVYVRSGPAASSTSRLVLASSPSWLLLAFGVDEARVVELGDAEVKLDVQAELTGDELVWVSRMLGTDCPQEPDPEPAASDAGPAGLDAVLALEAELYAIAADIHAEDVALLEQLMRTQGMFCRKEWWSQFNEDLCVVAEALPGAGRSPG